VKLVKRASSPVSRRPAPDAPVPGAIKTAEKPDEFSWSTLLWDEPPNVDKSPFESRGVFLIPDSREIGRESGLTWLGQR